MCVCIGSTSIDPLIYKRQKWVEAMKEVHIHCNYLWYEIGRYWLGQMHSYLYRLLLPFLEFMTIVCEFIKICYVINNKVKWRSSLDVYFNKRVDTLFYIEEYKIFNKTTNLIKLFFQRPNVYLFWSHSNRFKRYLFLSEVLSC